MAEKLQDTSQITTNTPNKAGLVTDLNSSYIGEENYSHARNATRNSREGDLGTIGNEPSNGLCFTAPYNIIGHVTLSDDDILIFSTDNINSEIGIANSITCDYSTILNDPCLNFSDQNPITGVAKKDFHKSTVATFTDKRNPVRRIVLNDIDEFETCDDVLLFKKIELPCIELRKGQVGNLPNGMYSVAIAYVIDKQIFSDWYSISDRIAVNNDTGNNSIEVTLSNLDQEFDEFAVVVVGSFIDPATKGVSKLAKIIGYYSTRVRTLSITDFLNSTYKDIPLSDLTIQKKTWLKAGIISSNANILLLGDLVGREEEDYQLKAMDITAEYVVTQVRADYYEEDGRDVGYYRDENYDFYIQGVYNTGELTDKYHIPGRLSTSDDTSPATGQDVYEFDNQFNDCNPTDIVPRWKVENTAGRVTPFNNDFICERREYGSGEFGYHESTELYPDNPAMFGEYINTPIRHHRFPDESIIPRRSVINGITYINILGVRFSNIPAFTSPDIIGYKITRSDRKGGNGTVIARGIMSNMRSYFDIVTNQTVYYNNYTVNDLSPDQYISSTQTVFRRNRELNFTPLSDFHADKFAFHAPHALFEPRYTLGTEVKIECEEIADVKGQFSVVYNHPKQKLLNQFSFWLASAVGLIEAALILIGKRNNTTTHTGKNINETTAGDIGPFVVATDTFGLPINNYNDSVTKEFRISSVEDLVGLDIGSYIADNIAAGNFSGFALIRSVLTLLAATVVKLPYSIFGGIKAAEDIFNTIYDFTGFTDYVYQYNAHAKFTRSVPIRRGNKRRRLLTPSYYIPPTTVSTPDGKIINNEDRERYVFFELNKPVAVPTVTDDTRQTPDGFGICDNITEQVTSTGSMYYATSKTPNPNQYGQLGSAFAVSMHSCTLSGDETPTLFGGDCIITRVQQMKKMPFFTQDLANTNYPPGTEYDYRKYHNIGFTRYWMDSTKFDFSELVSGNVVNFARFSRTTTSKHNLSCKGGDEENVVRIDDAYMFLSNNCAIDFLVECDYHAEYREETEVPFFWKKNQNLTDVFRSDRLERDEEFVISRAYSDLYPTEIYAPIQRDDFDPTNPIPSEQSNSVVYSLPAFNLQNADNWQYFLPANYFSFRESDFGELTGIHKLDQDRIIFLFSKASPYISLGQSVLQLSNQTVTVGDGGLFAQDPREIMPTDNNYGACNSRYAFSNTHLGRFYPSARQGRILNFTSSLDDITRQGISYWCKSYMPIQLYNYFPNYPRIENPVSGVGYLTVFDSFNETVYVTKRDFTPKREYVADIQYIDNTFTYKGTPILLRSQYFNDVSWTLSYCPVDKGFVSFHDWHPDWVIQRDDHFMTVKGNGVWKHNERTDSFCVFYNVQHPFEIEFISASGQTVHTARSLEYLLEVYTYKNFGRNRFHDHHVNFDNLIVSNTEQISPLLGLNYRSSDPDLDILYPFKDISNPVKYQILFSKEENKYRINQFWDAVKDRGEFGFAEVHLFPVDESGYKAIINPLAIDMDKLEEQRKKFRHYFNRFRLIKTASGEHKFIVKLFNIKKLISFR